MINILLHIHTCLISVIIIGHTPTVHEPLYSYSPGFAEIRVFLQDFMKLVTYPTRRFHVSWWPWKLLLHTIRGGWFDSLSVYFYCVVSLVADRGIPSSTSPIHCLTNQEMNNNPSIMIIYIACCIAVPLRQYIQWYSFTSFVYMMM